MTVGGALDGMRGRRPDAHPRRTAGDDVARRHGRRRDQGRAPGRGDDTRAWGPPFIGTESAYFLGVNRNKRSLTLDLTSPGGLDVLRRLVLDADVVIDNFKVGTLERWGLDRRLVRRARTRLSCAARSRVRLVGTEGRTPGYDFILQAETGLMAITGEPDGESMKLGVAIVDVCTGMLATISVLGALAAGHGRDGASAPRCHCTTRASRCSSTSPPTTCCRARRPYGSATVTRTSFPTARSRPPTVSSPCRSATTTSSPASPSGSDTRSGSPTTVSPATPTVSATVVRWTRRSPR